MSGLDQSSHEAGPQTRRHDAIVVGAGFAGLYALYRFRELGMSVRVLERGDSVGGTWFWNRYPGARCDVESVDYSYSFSPELEQEWEWSERFATQPEILCYLNHVADRFELRRDIELETLVTQAHFHEDSNRWLIRTSDGKRYSAKYCVMATGCLSSVNTPKFNGLETFEGDWYHTARWPHEGVDFTGRRVGVIGTGSTGIQAIPRIAEHAEHLYVFQRTPNFSMPARNRPLHRDELREAKATYRERRAVSRVSQRGTPFPMATKSALEVTPKEREAKFEAAWADGGPNGITGSYLDISTNTEANELAAQFVRAKIREIVEDPAVAELLMPKDHPIGTKRICVDTDYYRTYNRDNVTLVDVRSSPIEEITPRGIRTWDEHYELDAIVFAIGFDAITGALSEIDIRGRGFLGLKDKWAEGPRTYLGLGSVGFPNLFLVTGPGSPSVLSNMVTSIEQHIDWTTDCVDHLERLGVEFIEATADAEDGWVHHVNEVARETLYPSAASWYMGANIPGKPRIFMPYIGGVGAYREICDRVAANGYEGFRLGAARTADPVAAPS